MVQHSVTLTEVQNRYRELQTGHALQDIYLLFANIS